MLALTIGFASAGDSNSTDVLDADDIHQDALAADTSVEDASFVDIQNAINSTVPGETLFLNGGTYHGNGKEISVERDIVISGDSSGDNSKKSVLDAHGMSRIFYISQGCSVTLNNIIFKNAKAVSGSGVYHGGGDLNMDSCTFMDFNITGASVTGVAVYIGPSSKARLNNLELYHNTATVTGDFNGFFYLGRYSSVNISNIDAHDNNVTANGIYGGIFQTSSDAVFRLSNYTSIDNTFVASYRLYGGNVYINQRTSFYGKNILIKGNVFQSAKNTVTNHDIDGAGFVSFGPLNVMDNFTFCDNFLNSTSTSQAPGGMAFFSSRGTVNNFSNCNISNNRAYHVYLKYTHPLQKESGPIQAMLSLSGVGYIRYSNFTNNFVSEGMASLQIVPSNKNAFIVEFCTFRNNLGGSSSTKDNRTYFVDHAGAICVSGGYNGAAIIRDCTFINNTDSQGGAITPHNNCLVERCIFINNTATKFYGGAISTEDGLDMNNANITIRDCYFEGNSAPIGGAIQAKGDHVVIDNCSFKGNYAVQGGAVFLEGNNLQVTNCNFTDNNATYDLDPDKILVGQTYMPQVQVWNAFGGAVYIHGFNSYLENNRFLCNSAIRPSNDTLFDKGGAIYIFGDNATVMKCYFDDNFAHSGNGSAVYVMGVNATVDLSEFYNHDAGRGTVFVHGSHASVLRSQFRANTASSGGAGIYSIGNHSLVDDCTFENNNATIHGGAIHTYGDYIRVLNSRFISNNAHPREDDHEFGLGGAIYTKGDFNDIAYCEFDLNTARNGSAIYNRGSNLTVDDCRFHYNQAYSYLLAIKVTPVKSIYTKDNRIVINVTHIGGDNIINAIYNDGSHKNIFFYNVTYEHSSTAGGERNSGLTRINPVESAEKSQNGELIYQDSREDLQIVDVIITREADDGRLMASPISGDIIKKSTGRTGLYGNLSMTLTGDLKPGMYNVYASHPDDKLYKGIENSTRFEISPQVDLSIKKSSDRDSYFVGDTATFTITLESLGTDAHDVNVTEIMPQGFELIAYTASKGSYSGNVWSIPTVSQGATETLKLKVKLNQIGTFTNRVNVTCLENDTDSSNNAANKTVKVKAYVDLDVKKEVNVKVIRVGDMVVWTITVKNNGIINATGVKVTDKLSEALKYIDHYASKGSYDLDTGVWSIDEVAVNETVTLQITTQVMKAGNFTNRVSVTSNEADNNLSNNEASASVEAMDVDDNVSDKNVSKYGHGSDDNTDPSPVKYVDGHATGNPILLALVALFVICTSIRRKP